LFAYINQNKGKKITLVCEDMNRLARDMLVYLSLKLEFERKNIKVLYVNQEIEDSPQGRIVEQMFMMIAQFFREENKQRVMHRQKSRLEDGYWCFGIPKGYKWSTNKRGGKKLLLDEPACHIVKEALEKFADYELNRIIDYQGNQTVQT
jgi:DNA invertase Pin-like site-specific DNA recombinase